MKRIINIPVTLDDKFYDDQGVAVAINPNWISENVKANLDAFADVGDEHITFIVHSQDSKGDKRFGLATTSWNKLKTGDEIQIMGKTLVVQKEEETVSGENNE